MGPEAKKKNQLGKLKPSNQYDDINTYINEADEVKGMSNYILDNTTTNYQHLEKMGTNEDHTVHHANGTKNAEKGDYVFEFNTAGSGNDQWVKMYKGFSGYNEKFDFTPEKQEEVPSEKNYYEEIAKGLNQKYGINLNEKINQQELANALEEEYGKPMYMGKNNTLFKDPGDNTRIMSGIRVKDQGNKKIMNLSGPLGQILFWGVGMRNSGDYSIENLRNYIYQTADKWLQEVQEKANQPGEENKPIHFYMQGHSRGGVATNEASAMINHLITEKYPNLRKRIHMHVTVFDPVPGTGSYGDHEIIDQKQQNITLNKGIKAQGLMAGEVEKVNNEENVLYSLHSNHSFNFAPQTVMGAKRLFLTGMNHDMGLYDVAVDKNGKRHKRGYISAENGEEYRGTGMYDLKEGLYVIDEKNIIVELKNKQEAIRMLDQIYNNVVSIDTQAARHETMYQVVDNWFAHHKETLTPKDTRYAPAKAIKDDVENIKKLMDISSHPNISRDEAEIRQQQTHLIASLFAHTNLYNKCQKDPERLTDKALNRYRMLSKDKNLVDSVEKSARFQKYMETVTDETISKMINGEGIVKKGLAEEYNKFFKTQVPELETPKDAMKKIVDEDIRDLKYVANDMDPTLMSHQVTEPMKEMRSAVAKLIFHQKTVTELSKQDGVKNPENRGAFLNKLKKMDSSLEKFENSAEFNRFYDGLTQSDIQNLAEAKSPKEIESYVKVYDAVAAMKPAECKLDDIGRFLNNSEKVSSSNMFMRDSNGKYRPEATDAICHLLYTETGSFDNIFNPYQFESMRETAGEQARNQFGYIYSAGNARDKHYLDIYKEGMKQGIEYLDKAAAKMKNFSVAELMKPENKNILAVSNFLSSCANQMDKFIKENKVQDPQIQELLNKQAGLEVAFKSTLQNVDYIYQESIGNRHRTDDPDGMYAHNLFSLKSKESLFSEALKMAKKQKKPLSEVMKSGGQYFERAFDCSAGMNLESFSGGIKSYIAGYTATQAKNGNTKVMPKDAIKNLSIEILTNSKSMPGIELKRENGEGPDYNLARRTFAQSLDKLAAKAPVSATRNQMKVEKAKTEARTKETLASTNSAKKETKVIGNLN